MQRRRDIHRVGEQSASLGWLYFPATVVRGGGEAGAWRREAGRVEPHVRPPVLAVRPGTRPLMVQPILTSAASTPATLLMSIHINE